MSGLDDNFYNHYARPFKQEMADGRYLQGSGHVSSQDMYLTQYGPRAGHPMQEPRFLPPVANSNMAQMVEEFHPNNAPSARFSGYGGTCGSLASPNMPSVSGAIMESTSSKFFEQRNNQHSTNGKEDDNYLFAFNRSEVFNTAGAALTCTTTTRSESVGLLPGFSGGGTLEASAESTFNQAAVDVSGAPAGPDDGTPEGSDGGESAKAQYERSVVEFHRDRALVIDRMTPEQLSNIRFLLGDLPVKTFHSVPGGNYSLLDLTDPLQLCSTHSKIQSRLFGSNARCQVVPLMHVVCVANVPTAVSEAELRGVATRAGPVRRCFLVRSPGTGASKGYGFVEFEERPHAEHFNNNHNGSTIWGEIGRSKLITSTGPRGPLLRKYYQLQSRCLVIGCIPPSMSQDKVRDMIRTLWTEGVPPKECVLRWQSAHEHLGFAVVDFDRAARAEETWAALRGRCLDGRELRVAFTVPAFSAQEEAADIAATFQDYFVNMWRRGGVAGSFTTGLASDIRQHVETHGVRPRSSVAAPTTSWGPGSEARVIACHQCREAFTLKSEHLRHMHIMHPDLVKQDTPGRSRLNVKEADAPDLQCRTCRLVFSNNRQLQGHIRATHKRRDVGSPLQEQKKKKGSPLQEQKKKQGSPVQEQKKKKGSPFQEQKKKGSTPARSLPATAATPTARPTNRRRHHRRIPKIDPGACPIKKSTTEKQSKWWSPELAELKLQARRAERQFLRRDTPFTRERRDVTRREYQRAINKAKRELEKSTAAHSTL